MRKKWLSSSLSLLIGVGILFTSCTKTVQKEYYEVIPEDVLMVGCAKINRLLEKSEAGTKLSHYAAECLGTEMAGKLDLFLKNDNASGLDLNANVFMFGVDHSGVVAKVADLSKLKEIFHTIQQEGGCEALSEKGGYMRTVIGGEMVCFFNEHLLLGLNIQTSAEETFAAGEKLLNGKDVRSISTTEGFQAMTAADSDLAWLLSLKALEGKNSNPFQNKIDFSKVSAVGTLNFENGKVGLTYKILSDDPTMKRWMSQVGNLDNRFLNCFPSTTLCYASTHIDGESICQQLEENEGWSEALQVNKDEFIKTLSAFSGDFSWGISSFNPMGIPYVLAYAQAKNAYPIQALAQVLKQQAGNMGQMLELKDKGKNTYEAKINMLGMSVYFGEKDGFLYLTNDSDSFRSLGKEAAKPLGNMAWVSGLKNAGSAFLLNVEETLKSPVVQMGVQQMVGMQQGAIMLQTLSLFSYVEILGVKDTAYLNIYLKDKDQNSLKVLVEEGTKMAQ